MQTTQLDEDKALQPIPEIKPQGEEFAHSLPHPLRSLSLEELLQGMGQKQCAVENDYVPDPQGSPQTSRHYPLQRSFTVSEPAPSHDDALFRRTPLHVQTLRNQAAKLPLSPRTEEPSEESDGGINPNKHLSVISMESGLGLTCDNDDRDDFNRSLPLEQQPWFYGPMGRGQVEPLLYHDGDFLVIEDTITRGSYILSLLWEGRCFHIQINCSEIVGKNSKGVAKVGQKYQFDNGAFDSVPELIYNHLRYRIPLSSEFDGVLINPLCHGIGSKGYESSSSRPYGTLPKNFGRSIDSNLDQAIASSDFYTMSKRASFRATRSASFSPIDSPRNSPSRDTSSTPKAGILNHTSYSSSNILRDTEDEDEISDLAMASLYHDVPLSPANIEKKGDENMSEDIPEEVRPRTISPYSTYDVPTSNKMASSHHSSSSHGTPRQKYDPDDYEVMGSVSIRSTLPPSPSLTRAVHSRSRSPSVDTHYSTVTPKSLRQEHSVPLLSQSTGVKYAEISFKRSMSSAAHADVVARGRAQTVTYATPRLLREELLSPSKTPPPPHPFSMYSQLALSSSSALNKSSPTSTPSPGKPSHSPKSPYTSRPGSIITGKNVKPPQTLGEIPSFLKEYTNDEIAIHLTKADAVCFLLTPRPGEDYKLWQNR